MSGTPTIATNAPTPVTTPNTNVLFALSSSSACCGNRIWIGA